ncbi:hypothetical protein HK100_009341 [Physocladia obscura]|uniref:Uncharacterized protein n=1 Tax=Physocladia obscura TaxID=109957 RepID=A0AAD5SPS0_9FUNG|nr:hypothetical protein HK100_009341 [Physocladia obscura]
MEESTFLSKAFAEQGLKIRIRKELRVKSRTAKNQQNNGHEVPGDKKRSSLDSDEEQSDGLSDSTDHANKKAKKERSFSDGPTNLPNSSSFSVQNENRTKNSEFPYKQPEASQQRSQTGHNPRVLYPPQYPPTHYPPSGYYPPPSQYQQYPRPVAGSSGPHPYAPYNTGPPPTDDSYGRRYSGEYSSPAPHGYPTGPGYGGYYYGGPYPPHGYYPSGPPQGYYSPPPPASYPMPPQAGRGYPVGPGGLVHARLPASGNYLQNDASPPVSGNPSSTYPSQPPPPPPGYMGYYYPNRPPHMAGGYQSRPPPPNQQYQWSHAPPPHHPSAGHTADPNAPNNGGYYPHHMQDGPHGYAPYPPAANGAPVYYQRYSSDESPTRKTAPLAQKESQNEASPATNGAANLLSLNSGIENVRNDGLRAIAPVLQSTGIVAGTNENGRSAGKNDDHVPTKLE